MNVGKIYFLSLFLLFLILGASSVCAGDADNSTETESDFANHSYYDDFAGRGEWKLDENGTPVWISPAKNHTYENASESNVGENVSDLRPNSSDNSSENIPEISSPAGMEGIWQEYIKNPKEFIEKYRATANATGFNINELNTSCSNLTSKELHGFLNFVRQIKDKPNSIESKDINVFYSKNNIYKVRILNPVGDHVGEGVSVVFTFKGKKISAKTDDRGYASFKFGAQCGKYSVKIKSGDISLKAHITVKALFKTKNVNKIYKKPSKFTVKLIKQKGKSVSGQAIKITFKGKNYKIKSNSKGIAAFNIAKNVKIGKYTIKTSYNGCVVKNTITVKR